MHKSVIAAAILGCMCLGARAQETDSLATEELQTIIVSAVRTQSEAPYAVSNIAEREVREFSTTGRELPFLFARTPGVLAWSENGVGTGTTYMRIRGAAGSRINVTLDGVPLNSPEDQTVFWANMNSYGRLLGSVQIQRGVGSSTNGDGAFGGTVSLGTRASSHVPSVELTSSYGSYNTFNYGVILSSGLLNKHICLDAAYHSTSTDGYIHGTAGNSGSYMAALSWIGRDIKIGYRLLGNYEVTGQAWNGVTAGNDDLSIMDGTYGTATGIHTYGDMYRAGLGRFNSLYESMTISGTDYSMERYKMDDGSLWPRTTDNFWQNHHILSLAWKISPYTKYSAAVHYTAGYGYYEEFRYNNKLLKYGIPVMTTDAGTVKRSDFVRQKGLDQDTYGVISNLSWKKGRWDAVAGLSVQNYVGKHFGYLTYASSKAVADKYLADGRYMYYDSPASKFDASCFAKVAYSINSKLNIYGDLQLRYVDFASSGYNDKYIDNGDGTASRHVLDIASNWLFFNPKAGFNYSNGANRVYGSVAVANREPERNNFTDNGKYPAPRSERLYDFESGYSYDGRGLRWGAGLYYMKYKDQLVQTGEKSDIGESLTTNIPDSYRAGIELSGAIDLCPWLTLEANAALSKNKLLDFDEYVEDWDSMSGVTIIHYSNSTLAFSPSAICNFFADFHWKAFSAEWNTSYVSRTYLDNTQNADRSLPAYSITNLSLKYTLMPAFMTNVPDWLRRSRLKEAVLGLDLGNLFNAHVAQSGWVYSALYASGGHTDDNRYYQIGFIPAPPFTITAHLTVRF
ncbi:MAG: TonB-dependent receptor [Bacteroidales bacterium]|nr:TonB-dependent receptor [Bacteroidales bacterium]